VPVERLRTRAEVFARAENAPLLRQRDQLRPTRGGLADEAVTLKPGVENKLNVELKRAR